MFRPRFNPPDPLPRTKQIRNENQIMDYTCTAEAKPYASIRWMLNGQNLTNTAPYNITERISGPAASKLFKTFGYLNIKHLTWQQYGNFSCVANNDAGSVKQNTELEVRYRPVVQSPADHPKNLTLAEGETATFNCKTIGNPPTTAHKWQFNGNDLQGEACNNCPTTTLRRGPVQRKDEGWYGCVGTNSLGDGPPAKAQLLIKRKPTIDYFPKSVYTVNETNNITMVCGADGVPRPTITWKKMSSGRIVGEGEEFHIVAASKTDDGVYICFAQNELGDDSKGVTLQVQTRPTILTSTPITTNIPGAAGEQVDLTCIVKGKPSPTLSWRRDPNGNDLSAIDEKVESITIQVKATTMKIIVTTAGKEVGDKFYCVATNVLGNDTQQYIIRERGPPDPPQDVKVVPIIVPDSQTVSVNVSWNPSYSGGYDQQFSIHYRKKGSGSDFTEVVIGLLPENMHTVQKLSPNTEYEFMMQASNRRGNSPASPLAQVTTSDAAVAPPRGTGKFYSRVRPSVSPRLYLMNRLFEKRNLLPVLAVVATSIKVKSAFLHA
ncbi:protein turtle homolog B-like [Porites lutea]|uniref:protein turtle homolog B-like n=1 Tax=Porites lutea TaxID=51062 RepID=UPI003CC5ECBE